MYVNEVVTKIFLIDLKNLHSGPTVTIAVIINASLW